MPTANFKILDCLKALLFVLVSTLPVAAFAEGGLINIVNWYHELAGHVFGEGNAEYWWPILSTVVVMVLVVVVGQLAGLHKLEPEKMSDEELLPPKKFSIRAFVELCWAVVSSTLEGILGEKVWRNYASLLGGTFFFILFANMMGLIPGFAPPTEQMNMTLGIAIIIFFAFNYVGLKHGGANYIKHLFGPVLFLAPLLVVIETIGLFVRPLSLSLRLFGNIMGDHLVFKVFSTLMRNAHISFLPLPAILLLFGTLVAGLQAFIFMTLSTVYVRLALDTAHHDH